MRRWTFLVAGTALLCLACGNLTGGDPPEITYEAPGATPELVDEAQPAGPCCCQVAEGTWEQLEACSTGICVDDSYCEVAEDHGSPAVEEVVVPKTTTTTTTTRTSTSSGRKVGGHMTRPSGSSSSSGSMSRPGSSKSGASKSTDSKSTGGGTMKRPR